MKRYQKMLIGLAVVVLIIGTGVACWAHGPRDRGCDRWEGRFPGMGYGFGRMMDELIEMDRGYDRWEGGFHGMGYGYGPMMDELSEKDQEKVKAAIDSFRRSNRESRQTIYRKEMALEAEMAKPEPNAGAASDLLKEIAALKTDAAQRWLEHRMEMKKIHPDLDPGFHHPDRGFHQRGFGGRDCPSSRGRGFRNKTG